MCGIDLTYKTALEFSLQIGKPAFCSEMGCPARANPYDVAIQAANESKTGYFLWELMIGKSLWNNRHGVVYPDGSVRDPSIAAAILGFFRNRSVDAVGYALNCEEGLASVTERARAWLSSDKQDREECENILNTMLNFIQSGELISMAERPSCRILKITDIELSADVMTKWKDVLTERMAKESQTIPLQIGALK